MKARNKIIFGVIAAFILFTGRADAISVPNLWKKTGTTITPINSTWDLEVDDLTVNGVFTFGGALSGSLSLSDDNTLAFGDADDATIQWDTADADANFLSLVLSGSRNLIISEDDGVDWGHAGSTNPRIWVQSADEASTNDYITLYHDQTDANVVSGSGQLNLVSGNGLVGVPGAVGSGTQRFLIRSAAGNQAGFELGEGAVSSLYFRANHGFDQGILAVKDQVGSQIVLGCESDQDYDHADQTDPTLFIHSCTAPNTANDEWFSFSHDTNDAIITVGKGDLNITAGALVVDAPIQGKKLVVDSGVNRNVAASESGGVFTNSAAMEFTLPTAEAGLTYTFIVADANYLRVNMAAGDQADYIGSTTALAGYFRSNNQGDVLEVVAIDDTTWQVTNLEGTWTFDE